jgi:hypothetical protein
MNPRNYALLAAIVFAIVAMLQLLRAVGGWPLTIATTSVPLSASWIAGALAGVLAILGFAASRR